jgi:hypothetical protein
MACNRIGVGVPLCYGVVHDSCDATNPWFEVHMVDPPISEFFSMTPNKSRQISSHDFLIEYTPSH